MADDPIERLRALRDQALADYQSFAAKLPGANMKRVEAERANYLHGRLRGLSAAVAELERKGAE